MGDDGGSIDFNHLKRALASSVDHKGLKGRNVNRRLFQQMKMSGSNYDMLDHIYDMTPRDFALFDAIIHQGNGRKNKTHNIHIKEDDKFDDQKSVLRKHLEELSNVKSYQSLIDGMKNIINDVQAKTSNDDDFEQNDSDNDDVQIDQGDEHDELFYQALAHVAKIAEYQQ